MWRIIKKPSFQFSRIYRTASDIPDTLAREEMNMFQAINNAMDIAMEKDSKYSRIIFILEGFGLRGGRQVRWSVPMRCRPEREVRH